MQMNLRLRQCGALQYYTSDRLDGVKHAFTTKAGGVSSGDCATLNLGFERGDRRENVLRNFELLTHALEMPLGHLTRTQQVHGDRVEVIETLAQCGAICDNTDAIVTALPNVPLAGFYADCVVTLLYDPVSRTCGVCHAGWRGTAMSILEKTADTMAGVLGTNRDSLIAIIGPSIHACCFETDADVPEAMESALGAAALPYIAARGAKFDIDLQGLNRQSLLRAGVRAENIVDSGLCTRCHKDEFWSHRATNGKRGVQAAIICI